MPACSSKSAVMRASSHSGSVEPSAWGTSTIHPPSSVSIAAWPRRASSASAVDLPVADMPVTRTAVTAPTPAADEDGAPAAVPASADLSAYRIG